METKYQELPFSLELAKVEGNKVVFRGNKEFEPEWHYFKTVSESEQPITAVNRNGGMSSYWEDGYYYSDKKPFQWDLIILQPIQEEKRRAALSMRENKLLFTYLPEWYDYSEDENVYEFTFINGEVKSMVKL